MVRSRDKQLQRIVHLVKEVKGNKYPTLKSFAKTLQKLDEQNGTSLSCSTKTIQRDINYINDEMGGYVKFDPIEGGYALYNKEWTIPELALGREELFAELFTRKLSGNSLLPCLKEHLDTGTDIQLAAAESEKISVSALNSVIHATGKVIEIDTEISEKILNAWKDCIQAEVHYAKSKKDTPEKRVLDIHGLFLSHSVWYCRAYCHKRQGFRSFVLHKFTDISLTKKKFERSAEVVKALKSGQLFDLPTLPEAKVLCGAQIAEYIQDREWFDGQEVVVQEDGSLELSFKNISEKNLKWWVMSFSGHLQVKSPESLRTQVRQAAEEILSNHQ